MTVLTAPTPANTDRAFARWLDNPARRRDRWPDRLELLDLEEMAALSCRFLHPDVSALTLARALGALLVHTVGEVDRSLKNAADRYRQFAADLEAVEAKHSARVTELAAVRDEYHSHLMQIAEELGEGSDIGACWESVHALVTRADGLQKRVEELLRSGDQRLLDERDILMEEIGQLRLRVVDLQDKNVRAKAGFDALADRYNDLSRQVSADAVRIKDLEEGRDQWKDRAEYAEQLNRKLNARAENDNAEFERLRARVKELEEERAQTLLRWVPRCNDAEAERDLLLVEVTRQGAEMERLKAELADREETAYVVTDLTPEQAMERTAELAAAPSLPLPLALGRLLLAGLNHPDKEVREAAAVVPIAHWEGPTPIVVLPGDLPYVAMVKGDFTAEDVANFQKWWVGLSVPNKGLVMLDGPETTGEAAQLVKEMASEMVRAHRLVEDVAKEYPDPGADVMASLYTMNGLIAKAQAAGYLPVEWRRPTEQELRHARPVEA